MITNESILIFLICRITPYKQHLINSIFRKITNITIRNSIMNSMIMISLKNIIMNIVSIVTKSNEHRIHNIMKKIT